MQYHYVGRESNANVFLPYMHQHLVSTVDLPDTGYPKAKVWAVFAFSPGVVGILVEIYLGIATLDMAALFSGVAMFALFGQLLFGIPAAVTGAIVVYLHWRKTAQSVFATAFLGGGFTWLAAYVVAKDLEVVNWYAAIGMVVALVVALLVLPKPTIKNKRWCVSKS